MGSKREVLEPKIELGRSYEINLRHLDETGLELIRINKVKGVGTRK